MRRSDGCNAHSRREASSRKKEEGAPFRRGPADVERPPYTTSAHKSHLWSRANTKSARCNQEDIGECTSEAQGLGGVSRNVRTDSTRATSPRKNACSCMGGRSIIASVGVRVCVVASHECQFMGNPRGPQVVTLPTSLHFRHSTWAAKWS